MGGELNPDPEGVPRAKRQPKKKYHLHPFVKQFLLNPLEWTAEQHLEVLQDRVSRAERELEVHAQAVELQAAASEEGVELPTPELSLPAEAWQFEHESRLNNLAEGVRVPTLQEAMEIL